MNTNIILLTDSYKVSHHLQYPPNTEKVYSYFESRGGKFSEIVFFGLQYFLERYLSGSVVTAAAIEQAEKVFSRHFGRELFHREGWEYILAEHGGRLPVRICAVAEGTIVPTREVLLTVENTDPRCYWLTNYIETLLVQLWYPTTVATLSREVKKVLWEYCQITGGEEGLFFKLHDFGFRGASSPETAALGGAAHLVNFLGTDTLPALELLSSYYGGAEAEGFSIPASEHSTITAWGQEGEKEAYSNMLRQFPEGLVACVSDSYDIYRACRTIWGEELHSQVLHREGTLVIRPDSGNIYEVVPALLDILGEKFGYSTNQQGYKVLPPQVRLIQGDGMEYDVFRELLEKVAQRGWSIDNIAFGMGGGLLQKVNRDTQKFAFKTSAIVRNGEPIAVAKNPLTDSGKRSKAGMFRLAYDTSGKLRTYSLEPHKENHLRPVFENGEMLARTTIAEIRQRAAL